MSYIHTCHKPAFTNTQLHFFGLVMHENKLVSPEEGIQITQELCLVVGVNVISLVCADSQIPFS